MEISFIGHACFKIKGKDLTIVVDPYSPDSTGYKLPKLSADVVLTTHDHKDHNFVEGVSDHRMVINGAGEYELSEAFVMGIDTYHDEKSGEERGKNTIYLIDIDGFTVLHLGDLGHELSKQTLEKLSDVDVLLIPVGGNYTIDAETAVKVISSVEPGIVVPMHYKTSDLKNIELATLDKFLDEMGVEGEVTKVDKLKVKSKSDIPEETEVVIIKPSH
jgi:L-ascorbate metabolism protein UlaG (beta-lactamase superfamily)